MNVGTEVSTNQRWPGSGFHPDCWEPPHKGIVLAVNNPRAWTNTVAFPGRSPDQEEVDKHLENLKQRNISLDRTPVLYSFGVQWETDPRPYDEVFADWQKAREAAYAKERKHHASA